MHRHISDVSHGPSVLQLPRTSDTFVQATRQSWSGPDFCHRPVVLLPKVNHELLVSRCDQDANLDGRMCSRELFFLGGGSGWPVQRHELSVFAAWHAAVWTVCVSLLVQVFADLLLKIFPGVPGSWKAKIKLLTRYTVDAIPIACMMFWTFFKLGSFLNR